MPTAEILLLSLFAIPIVAAFAIVRRERLQGAERQPRPFAVTLAIAIAIFIPLWALANIVIRALIGESDPT